ncbi:MAG TPA: biotin--[acetyl-CoA-carboxylase] ligase [Burkholderiales bacterium]|nr:biotin--[acetyl-CoA-carboxylase] ligase [Burkholderiales bacterium]
MQAAVYALLRRLQSGRIISGETLAHSLGLTRSVFVRLIAQCRAAGIDIRCVRGRGYFIDGGLDLLDADALKAALPCKVEIVDECDSTNTRLLEHTGETVPRLYVCEVQTAGRGRRGNRWYSGVGDSLSFSLLWPSALNAQQLSGLSLAVGVACLRALQGLDIAGLGLKWPNDLMHGQAKVGGVLIETRASVVVVGVGLNIRNAAARAAQVMQPVGDLAQFAKTLPTRTTLLAALSSGVLDALSVFEERGFAPFRDTWQRYDLHAGQRVCLSNGDRHIEGIARGVDERGALLLLTEAGEYPFFAGELSLRKAA